jgi:hypothetical protein
MGSLINIVTEKLHTANIVCDNNTQLEDVSVKLAITKITPYLGELCKYAEKEGQFEDGHYLHIRLDEKYKFVVYVRKGLKHNP